MDNVLEFPTPLSDSEMMAFLSDKKMFEDCCADAIFCPGPDVEDWEKATDHVRYWLFAVQECKENGMNPSYAEQMLATVMLRNIEVYLK